MFTGDSKLNIDTKMNIDMWVHFENQRGGDNQPPSLSFVPKYNFIRRGLRSKS